MRSRAVTVYPPANIFFGADNARFIQFFVPLQGLAAVSDTFVIHVFEYFKRLVPAPDNKRIGLFGDVIKYRHSVRNINVKVIRHFRIRQEVFRKKFFFGNMIKQQHRVRYIHPAAAVNVTHIFGIFVGYSELAEGIAAHFKTAVAEGRIKVDDIAVFVNSAESCAVSVYRCRDGQEHPYRALRLYFNAVFDK